MDRANGVGMPCRPGRIIWLGLVSLFLISATGCNERLKRMESNQVVLEEKIDQNARQALILARQMERSQGALEVRINRVQEGNTVALAETRATRYEQERLRDDTREFNKKWAAGILRVEEQQSLLQDAVNGVAGTATVIDEGVQKLDEGQGVARAQMAANQTETLAGFALVQSRQTDLKNAAQEAFAGLQRGQEEIRAVASEGVTATGKVSHQVSDLQVSQDAQTGIMRDHHKALIAKVDGVTEDQTRLQRLTSRQMTQLSQKVTAGQSDQAKATALQNEIMTERANAIDASLKTTQQNQKHLSGQIEGHHEYVMDLGTHVTAIEEEQRRLNDSIQEGNQTVDSAVKAVGRTQKKLEKTLINVESTAVATHQQTGVIADRQGTFHALEAQRHDRVLQAVAQVEASQNKAQGTLNEIDKKAQAIVGDTGAIREQQSSLDQEIQQEGTHIRQGLAQLEENQRQLQTSVNGVQATADSIKEMTAKNATDAQAIQDQQAQLAQGMAQEGGQIRQALADIEEDQDQTYRAVNRVQMATNTVASNTTTLMEQQGALQRTTHRNQTHLVQSLDRVGATQKTLSEQAESLKQGQAQLQTGQAGIEQKVGQVKQTQASLNRMFISEKTHLDAELQSIGNGQDDLQDGLSDNKSMSRDMALQIKRMQQDQRKMHRTMDMQQKAWKDQSDELAKRVAALEQSLGHVDQNVSSLQTNLVYQITELTKVIKALQAQGGAQIAQLTDDMKAFSDTLKLIQATQSNLAKRIDQVGANQMEQSKGRLTDLETLQKQTQSVSDTKPVEREPQDLDIVK